MDTAMVVGLHTTHTTDTIETTEEKIKHIESILANQLSSLSMCAHLFQVHDLRILDLKSKVERFESQLHILTYNVEHLMRLMTIQTKLKVKVNGNGNGNGNKNKNKGKGKRKHKVTFL